MSTWWQHKATKWHIMKVPTGPVMCPSSQTAGEIQCEHFYGKDFLLWNFQCNDEETRMKSQCLCSLTDTIKAIILFLSPDSLLGLCLQTRFLLNLYGFCFQIRIGWFEYVLHPVISQIIHLWKWMFRNWKRLRDCCHFALWMPSLSQWTVILNTAVIKGHNP